MSPRSRALLLAFLCAVVAALLCVVSRTSTPSPSAADDRAPAPPLASETPSALDLVAATVAERARTEPALEPLPTTERSLVGTRPDFEVRGRFVGADGNGVPNIACAIESVYVLNVDGIARTLGNSSQEAASARSGSDGSFVCALSPPEGGHIASVNFACRAQGYAVIWRYERVVEGQLVVELGDLVLHAGVRIAGFVRDAEGSAVDDARIHLTISSGEQRWDNTGVYARSKPDGSFALEGVPTGWLRMTARAADSRVSAPFELTVQAGDVREGIVLEMPMYEDPFAISGTVIGVDGAAVPEAPVRWSSVTGGATNTSIARAAQDGRFRMQGSEGSVFRVTASHPRDEARAVSRVDIAAGTHDIELRLTPLVTIPLRVRTPDGAFVPSFTYSIRIHAGSMVQGGTQLSSKPEDSSGTVIPVPADPFVVEVVADGFTTESSEKLSPDLLPPSIDVVLRPLPTLRGRVVRGDAPVAGARVRAHRAFARGASGKADVFDLAVHECEPCTEVETDSNGSFVLRVGAEGRWHARVASSNDPTVISHAVEVVSGHGAAEIVVDLAPRGAIAGRVRDTKGAPLARRTVAASCGDGSPVKAVTDADGAYRLAPLAPGSWQVRVLDPARAGANTMSFTSGPDDATPIAWDCRVVEGTVTRHDLVVAGP